MATSEEAKAALLEAIAEAVKGTGHAASLRDLAEAYAYTVRPNVSHGGSGTVQK